MKKILSFTLALTLMLCMVFSLASCSKMLSGKYTNSPLQTSYEFSGNKVTRTSPNLSSILGSGEETIKEGTYKITETEGGAYNITFTWADGEVQTETFTEIEINNEQSIKIGAITFTKEQ